MAAELDRDRGALFMGGSVVLGAGACTYFVLPREPSLWLLVALLLLSASGAWALRKRYLLRLAALAALVFACGMAAGKFETLRASTKMLGAEITTRLTGRVASFDHLAGGRMRLTLDVIQTERPALRYSPDRVRVSTRSPVEGLRAGSTVSGLVRLMPPSGPVRPGGYDFSFESFFDGIGANGFFLTPPQLAPHGGAESESWGAWIENAREAIAAHIRGHIPGTAGEIAAALVVGVRAGIPEEANEALRQTGLAHVLSISGLHMALVAGTIMGGLRVVLALFPVFASRKAIKKYAAAGALGALTAYLFISGAEVAARRSFIMLAVILVAVLVDRAALTMRNLAIAAILILLWAPHEIMGPSFQMSFAATAALIGGFGIWADRKGRRIGQGSATRSGLSQWGRRGAAALLGLAATSLIAGAATLVFGAYHFHRVSPLGLPANLLAMPVVSTLVMPFAVAATILMPLGLDAPFWAVTGFGLDMMLAIASWLAALSPIDAVGALPVSCLLATTGAILLATIPTTRIRLLALPLAALAVASFLMRSPAEIVIAEDGRLLAMRMSDGSLAINRKRPNTFTIENWQRASASRRTVKPETQDPVTAEAQPAGLPLSHSNEESAFRCHGETCIARHHLGSKVAVIGSGGPTEHLCQWADLLVVVDPTIKAPCVKKRRKQLILSSRTLARRGSAHIDIGRGSDQLRIAAFAIEEHARPWHEHRRFSRAARGLAASAARKPGPSGKALPDAQTASELAEHNSNR